TMTPTAAAEFLVSAVEDFSTASEETFATIRDRAQRRLQTAQNRHYRLSTGLERVVSRRVSESRRQYERVRGRVIHKVLDSIRRQESRLEARTLSPARLERVLRRQQEELDRRTRRLETNTRRPLVEEGRHIEHLEEKLRLLDPQRVLERGFALIRNADGALVRRVEDVAPDDRLEIRLADGTVRVTANDDSND
ncbi:MAG: exodeoxyribonuclease VII large subunit, partial [Bradymonadaceae bacterium]